MFLFYPQGQLEQEEGAGEGMDKKDDMLRLSLTSLKEDDMEEDPLKTNRALAELLVSDRRPTATPIGVEEVLKICKVLHSIVVFAPLRDLLLILSLDFVCMTEEYSDLIVRCNALR